MKRWVYIALAATLAFPCTPAAFADEGNDAPSTAAAAEDPNAFKILSGDTEIEKLFDAYAEARDAADAVNAEIETIQTEIDSIEAELPAQQARSDAGLKQRYIMQSNPLVVFESLVSVNTLQDFIRQTDYIERISKANLVEFNRLKDMKAHLDQARSEQEKLKEDADARLTETESALRAVEDERAQKQADSQEFAIRQAEVQGGPNSIEKDEDSTSKNKSKSKKDSKSKSSDAKKAEDAAKEKAGVLPQVEATMDTTGIEDGADWHADRDTFVDEWATRIDAYLAGSPLEGQGRNFAAAAWKYGIDPRWSPAISNTESSKGAYCIRPHNAWGWGAADSDPYGLALEWGSWEEAIDAHVKGLAEGYGYTVSMSKARTYCPPNWQRWYNNVLRDMASM